MAESLNALGSPKSLEATGERFLPGEMHGSIELEHLHRYIFAGQLVGDKAVLDIASGEGYGSFYLAKFARNVVGVDIANEAVDHAKAKYSKDNLAYRAGSCTAIPVEDSAIEVIVSFETIEHHVEHEAMMREFKRVLRPDGKLVISSPDKLEYSDKPSFQNPFHVKELYFNEFRSLLEAHFKNVQFYGQRVLLASALFSQSDTQNVVFSKLGNESAPAPNMPMPLYWIAVASDEKLPAISGGILEQPLADLWRDIAFQRSANILELINEVAKPSSDLLKSQLRGSWYLQQNPDIAKAGVDPYEHWLKKGVTECRMPAADPIALARDLVSERDRSLRVTIEEKEHELRQLQHESLERQKALNADIAQTRLKARADMDAQLRILAERELAFVEQLALLRQTASQEMAAQKEIAQQQMSALSAQHVQQDQLLRTALEEKERELRRFQLESLEQLRSREADVAQTRIKARAEMDAQLLTLAERERAFAEQLAKIQQTSNEEMAAQREMAQQQMSASNVRYAQQEEMLRATIEEKERELRQVQHESLIWQKDFAERLMQIQHDAGRERIFLKERYSRHLLKLSNVLGTIQSSWSWRLTAPLRGFSTFFGLGTDFGLSDAIQCSSEFSPDENEIMTPQENSTIESRDSATVDQDKQAK